MIHRKTPEKEVIKKSEKCSRCGNCCKYDGCMVLPHEVELLAKHIGESQETFTEKYLERKVLFNKEIYKTRTIKEDRPYGACVFHADNKCLLHDAKPLHCKIGSCRSHGEDAIEWYLLNYVLDTEDPQAIREWAVRLTQKKTIPGGRLHELVPDKKKLDDILNYRIMRKDEDWERRIGMPELKWMTKSN